MSDSLKTFEDLPHELIKDYLINPDKTTLPVIYQNLIDRVHSLQHVLQRYPQAKTALSLHCAKFPDISRRTAFNDLTYARELDNTYHSFNYEFYNNWLINDILDQIQAAKAKGDMRAWAAGHANLKKAIGERPVAETDPKLLEKHTFLIQINNMPDGVNINLDTLQKLPKDLRQKLSDTIYDEITDEQADQMIHS